MIKNKYLQYCRPFTCSVMKRINLIISIYLYEITLLRYKNSVVVSDIIGDSNIEDIS